MNLFAEAGNVFRSLCCGSGERQSVGRHSLSRSLNANRKANLIRPESFSFMRPTRPRQELTCAYVVCWLLCLQGFNLLLSFDSQAMPHLHMPFYVFHFSSSVFKINPKHHKNKFIIPIPFIVDSSLNTTSLYLVFPLDTRSSSINLMKGFNDDLSLDKLQNYHHLNVEAFAVVVKCQILLCIRDSRVQIFIRKPTALIVSGFPHALQENPIFKFRPTVPAFTSQCVMWAGKIEASVGSL